MEYSLRSAALLLGSLALLALPASCLGDTDDKKSETAGKGGIGAAGSGATGASGSGASGGFPSGGTGGSTSGGTGGSTSGGSAGIDGAAGSPAAGAGGTAADSGLCNTIVNTGSIVPVVAVAAPLPAQTGGGISPGKYILTDLTMYTGVDGGTGSLLDVLKEPSFSPRPRWIASSRPTMVTRGSRRRSAIAIRTRQRARPSRLRRPVAARPGKRFNTAPALPMPA